LSVALYDNLLVLAAIALAIVMLRTLRRPGGGQRAYAAVLGVQLVLALSALVRDDRFTGAVAIGMCALTVGLPALLERLARQMFGLGRPRLAVRMSGLRAMLMPGAGLGRQQQILHGFALLDRDGVDAALAYFRGLAAAAEEPTELAVIHEQLVAMLLYGHRWGEAVAHYESQFRPGFAALRPTLALGMLRAYGELGRVDASTALLRAIEDGPFGAEPGAAELLGQCRLTYLAHAGALGAVEDALADRGRRLGLSPGTATLFHAIACARAGQPDRARELLRTIPDLAERGEARLPAAARDVEARVDDPAPQLSSEQQNFVQDVAERLRGSLQSGPLLRKLQPLVLTTTLLVALSAHYVFTLAMGWAGVGLLRAGALTPELFRAGSWGRVFTAPFVHGDLISLLLDCYSIWLAGHVLERIQGGARTGLVAILGAAAGMWAAAAVNPDAAQMIGGGNALAVSVLVATLWTLSPLRTPGLAPGVRRSVAVTLLILLGAHLFACLPGVYGLRSTPLSLGAAAFVASAVSLLLPPSLPEWTRRPLALLCAAALGVAAFAGYKVAREDPTGFALAHRERHPTDNGVRLSLPASFEAVAAGAVYHPAVPVFASWLDRQALRGGHVVQLTVVEGSFPADGSAFFALDPALSRELVAVPDPSHVLGEFTEYTLQRNGETVARVVERPVGDRTVLLIATPPSALEQAPELYAAILADAALADR
jgi:membrane associated rhomboid family serine protease